MLVVPHGDEERTRRDVVERYGFKKVVGVIPGGKERQDSVRLALDMLPDSCNMVVVHDGVRPFITAELVESVLSAASTEGAAVAGVPVKDTIKEVSSGIVIRTVPRERLWSVQTPQAFRTDLLREAHEKAHGEGFYGTDDAALLERLGYSVAMVKGSFDNIKITTPEDMVFGEAIITAMG